MKFGAILHVVLLFATPILAGVAPATAAEECGALGVMTYTAAGDTKGVDPAQIRKCLEHPLGANPRPEGTIGPRPEASSANGGGRNMNATDTTEHWWWHKHGYGWKSCWDVDPGEYGCSGGYCYKACDGDGRWCWTARNQGYGSWKTCDAKADCRDVADVGCGKKCRACGCSC